MKVSLKLQNPPRKLYTGKIWEVLVGAPTIIEMKLLSSKKTVVSSYKKQPNLKACLSVSIGFGILSIDDVDSAQPTFASTLRLMNI